jgi:hypothetical protein
VKEGIKWYRDESIRTRVYSAPILHEDEAQPPRPDKALWRQVTVRPASCSALPVFHVPSPSEAAVSSAVLAVSLHRDVPALCTGGAADDRSTAATVSDCAEQLPVEHVCHHDRAAGAERSDAGLAHIPFVLFRSHMLALKRQQCYFTFMLLPFRHVV